MFESGGGEPKRVTAYVPYALVAVLGVSLGGYAIHEHHSAQNLAAKNAQATTELHDTQHELSDLTTKVNMIVARDQQQQAEQAAAVAARKPSAAHRAKIRVRREDPRWAKMQTQLEAENKAIQDTQTQLADARTQLGGSIAHTHDELVQLEKRGERNYVEFDLPKSKQFSHKGPFGIRLRKANVKHQYADLELLVDDRSLTQKHVNLYQPVMFSTPDSPQPVQVVINSISKNHIHGYISAPKYRQSELASMSGTDNSGQGTDAGTVATEPQLVTRQTPSAPQQ